MSKIVRQLPPETLHQLIRSRGLDACSDLVTSATPAQLTSVLDLDLWRRAQAGRDEFDADRFGEWLEVLVDAGESAAARTLAALDKDLVVTGLSRYVRVFDLGIFEPVAQSDDEPADRATAMREGDSRRDGLECEIAGYVVRARRADAWDAIVTLLVALDAEHGDYFHAVMQGCRDLSNSRPEIDGLDDLLQAPDQQLHDVAVERERRRSQQGYATAADARAFLEMARRPKQTPSITSNPIATAYFRAADEASEPPPPTAPPEPPHASDVTESLHAFMELLTEEGVMPERARALLAPVEGDAQAARLSRLRTLMAYVHHTDEAIYFARSRELAFLANALIAGGSVQSRAFTPREASDAAAAICNLGLDYWLRDLSLPESWLIDHDLVAAFEVGWSVLHCDVGLYAADQLIAILPTLVGLDYLDRDTRNGLVTLERMLVKQRAAGTPWHARDAAEVLAMLDMTAWAAVLGLLDECPVVAAALTANLAGGTRTVSPTAFEFIATRAQIGEVRLFLRRLADLLSR